MKRICQIAGFALAALMLCGHIVLAQSATDRWLRVITGEESIIEVDKSSLVLDSNRLIHADFRTTWLKDEPIPEKPGVKYLSRVDSIQFNVTNAEYRILNSTLFDSSGKLLLSWQPREAKDWKSAQDNISSRLYRAVVQLAPFGSWTIKSYRYLSGETPQKDDPSELTSLVGAHLSLYLDNVHISDKTCHQATFEPLTMNSDEFLRKFGTSLTTLGIHASQIDGLMLACETVTTLDSSDPDSIPTLRPKGAPPPTKYTIVKRTNPKEFPEQTLILRLDNRKALMLWDGVFLEIERPGNPFLP